MDTKQTFALYFGNRGFFPGELIADARREVKNAVEKAGFGTLLMDENLTRYGAVETVKEGRAFADFLAEHKGEYDGIILSLPNFGDENGAVTALESCGVPILIQAYPDEIGEMDFQHRRDAFCGKFSIMDVFYQYGLPFTIFPPHTAAPGSDTFAGHLRDFAALCRVVRGMKKFTIGAIGARTTAFKTVRFDELALQSYGITTETLDLSEVIRRIRTFDTAGSVFKEKEEHLRNYTTWKGVPEEKIKLHTALGCVLDELIEEYSLDALALRCWNELELDLGISPCVLLSDLNNRGTAAACELDVCNAVAMRALALASDGPATVLDWNNNYGDDPEKCILFHCGPVPQDLMTGKGHITDHPMFAKAYGKGSGWGCNEGRIAPGEMSFCSAKTEKGKLIFYCGEGSFTPDVIEDAFFGCAAVAQIPNLQKKLNVIGKNGFRHHVSATHGRFENVLREAFSTYLEYDILEIG